MNTETFWKSVACRLDAGTPVYATLVVANTRGSPGTLGARLLLDSDGAVEGTIGGGIMEANLLETARRQLAERQTALPVLQHLVHRKKGEGEQSGLICAGEQTNLHLVFEPERDAAAVRRFYEAVADQSGPSATLEVDARGLRITEGAPDNTVVGKRLIQNDGEWCYRESSLNPRRLVIVGGGHCGRSLAGLATDIGYSVEVFDNRPDVLHTSDWPTPVRRHVLNTYSDLRAQLNHPSHSIVVVMTATVFHDIDALESVALMDLRWLGVMGSVAKIHKIHSDLLERGIPSSRVETIRGPIGMKIKSDTPPEIAVSIMGQLLSERPEEAI